MGRMRLKKREQVEGEKVKKTVLDENTMQITLQKKCDAAKKSSC